MAVTPPTLTGIVSSDRTGPPAVSPNTLTFAHTVPACDVLGVYVQSDVFGGAEPGSVTWMGNALELVMAAPTAGTAAFLYQLINPTPGSGDIVVSHTHPFGATLAAAAFQINDFGGWRWAELGFRFSFDADPTIQPTRIYATATDLVLTFFEWPGSGITVAADAGQTVLDSSQSGAAGAATTVAMGQVNAPVNTGLLANAANYTESTWTASGTVFNTSITNFMVAVMGLDRAAPAGAPVYIGRVVDGMSWGQQPTTSTMVVADGPQRWRMEIPSTHRTLVVLVTQFDALVAQVYYQPDGEAEIAIPNLPIPSNPGKNVWMLEDAPAGLGYIRVTLDRRRFFSMTAVAISAENVIGDIVRFGIDPGGMEIDSTPGGIVIDRMANLNSAFQQWTPDGGGAGQTALLTQTIYAANTRSGTPSAEAGGTSWATAIATSTIMRWTQSPSGFNQQCGISFVGVTPPTPPPERPGCPTAIEVLPADGVGCNTQLAPQAV